MGKLQAVLERLEIQPPGSYHLLEGCMEPTYKAIDSTYILMLVKTLGDEERIKLITDVLPNNYCMECGDEDPRCPCWNDE